MSTSIDPRPLATILGGFMDENNGFPSHIIVATPEDIADKDLTEAYWLTPDQADALALDLIRFAGDIRSRNEDVRA